MDKIIELCEKAKNRAERLHDMVENKTDKSYYHLQKVLDHLDGIVKQVNREKKRISRK